ncbi:helix-turn-helix domain-containing protein [Micromonospora sp. CA-240977]|uniref:helix-turn-helix domain-containing protein n=1 Tax=Micromonospora sp. CA-240977 TaxID=3239957 RepID=UPI003D8E647E
MRDAGWRSAMLRRLTNDRTVECLELPALTDQTIVLVTRGRALVESRTDGGRWQRCDYGPGRIGMTAPGRAATLRWRTYSPENKETLHLYLPGQALLDCADQLCGRVLDAEDLPDALGTNDRLVEAIMLAMADAAARGADDLYAESAVSFLIVHLLTALGADTEVGGLGPRDARLRQAVEFMHDNLALPITLADIARAAGLSSFHFGRMFAAAVGEPPRRYLTRLRIEAACRHLERGDNSVTDVAYLCGFSSSAHFAAALRRHTGMTPTQYRRRRTAR